MAAKLLWVSLVLAIATPATAGPWVIDRSAPASSADGEERFSEPVLPPAPRPLNPWKPIFGVSLGLAITATAVAYYSIGESRDEINQIVDGRARDGSALTDQDCGEAQPLTDADQRHFESACSWNLRGKVGLMGAVGLGTFTIVAAYFAFRSQPSDRLIAVTPTVTRESAGAQLSLAW